LQFSLPWNSQFPLVIWSPTLEYSQHWILLHCSLVATFKHVLYVTATTSQVISPDHEHSPACSEHLLFESHVTVIEQHCFLFPVLPVNGHEYFWTEQFCLTVFVGGGGGGATQTSVPLKAHDEVGAEVPTCVIVQHWFLLQFADDCVAPPPPPPTKTVKQNCSVQKYSCPFTGKTGKRKQCCSITVTCDSNNKCSEQAGQCSWVGEITWDVVAVTYKTCLSVATTENCNRIQCCEYSRVGDQVNKGNCEFQGVETCKEVVTKECHQKKKLVQIAVELNVAKLAN